MKRIRCPKCDEAILFDDSLYVPGRTLVFECPACRKQFKIRVGEKKLSESQGDNFGMSPEDEEKEAEAYVVVLENAFHLRQIIPLFRGDNRIGRHVKGTKAEALIKTVDPSVDETHCVIRIVRTKKGALEYTLRDGPSGTGTFFMNELVGPRERVKIGEGAIVTIGATTMIFHEGRPPEED